MKLLLLFIAVVALGSSCTVGSGDNTLRIIRSSSITVNNVNTRVSVTLDTLSGVTTYDSIVTRTNGIGDNGDRLVCRIHNVSH